jgi:hypothetical protein
MICKMHCGCYRRKIEKSWFIFKKTKNERKSLGCNSPTHPPVNLASQIAVGWASRGGSPNLGKLAAGGIPRQGLPTLGSCSYATKGALRVGAMTPGSADLPRLRPAVPGQTERSPAGGPSRPASHGSGGARASTVPRRAKSGAAPPTGPSSLAGRRRSGELLRRERLRQLPCMR